MEEKDPNLGLKLFVTAACSSLIDQHIFVDVVLVVAVVDAVVVMVVDVVVDVVVNVVGDMVVDAMVDNKIIHLFIPRDRSMHKRRGCGGLYCGGYIVCGSNIKSENSKLCYKILYV